MSRPIIVLVTLLILSAGLNLILASKVSDQKSVIDSIAARPTGLEGAFVVTAGFRATDSVTGQPVEGLKFLGVAYGRGVDQAGVSAAFDAEGRLVLFGHGSAPFEVSVGAPGYEPSEVTFSPMTPSTVNLKLEPETQ